MTNSEVLKQANEPRGVRKHVARYFSRPGRQIDPRTVGFWGEGHPSFLDDFELGCHAYALANPDGFHLIRARAAEILDEICGELTERRTEKESVSGLHRECWEFFQAQLDGKPKAVRRKELMDVVASAMAELRRMDDEDEEPKLRKVG